MTREEQLIAMRPRDLIALADRLGVKVAASKNRVNLKEKKSDVVDRILLAEGEVDAVDETPVEAVDSTLLEDVESESTAQVVEFVRPEQNFNLREFLTGATYVANPISEYIPVKQVVKNDKVVGTVTVLAGTVTITVGVDATDGIEVYNVPAEEYEAVRAEVG